MKKTLAALCGLSLMITAPAFAKDGWSLSADESKIAFASVKKDTVGEVHHFGSIDGSVDKSGNVSVEIDLASVETWIDIRNERMQKFVFGSAPKAMLKATVNIEELEAIKAGDTDVIDVEGTLKLGGNDIPIETSLFIARMSDDKMVAVTDEMIMLGTDEAGIDGSISKLMELAKLPGITRVSPVTLRLVFTR